MSAQVLLEARGLTFTHGAAKSVDGVDLTLMRGETLGLIGPNGSGKSTLLCCLAGLYRPNAGKVLLGGCEMATGPAGLHYRRRTAVVFQEPLLLDASVAENVGAGLKFRGLAKAAVADRVAACLELFGLTGLSKRNALSLSGGEAQKTSLARAFALSPEVLFLDEPFSSLDPLTREEMLLELKENLKRTESTALLVTHDRDEALRLCHRLAVMVRGKIVQVGPPEEVQNRPKDEFVASFVGVETILPGIVAASEGGMLTVRVGEAVFEAMGDNPPNSRVLLCIRPENVTVLDASATTRSSARNRFPGLVTTATFAGALCRLSVDCGFTIRALLTSASARELGVEEGKKVALSIKATAIHVLSGG